MDQPSRRLKRKPGKSRFFAWKLVACAFFPVIIARANRDSNSKICRRFWSATRTGAVTASPKEHFGFTDAIGDPIFEGQYPNGYERAFKEGNGALDGKGNWRPLATGEFLLGYPDARMRSGLPPPAPRQRPWPMSPHWI